MSFKAEEVNNRWNEDKDNLENLRMSKRICFCYHSSGFKLWSEWQVLVATQTCLKAGSPGDCPQRRVFWRRSREFGLEESFKELLLDK